MAFLFNMNTHININDTKIISWKGKTFTQITSIIQQNNKSTGVNLFSANPLKIYRREIASNYDNSHCSSRISNSIDEFNRPGGSLVYINPPNNQNGLVNTLDINLIKNKTDIPGNCSSCVNTTSTTGSYGFSPAQNALKRVRSSGMIKRQFDISTNKPSYYTNTNQYLTSRNKTQEQNQFNFLTKGDSTTTPGTAPALSNAYSANGTPNCNGNIRPTVYYKPNNSDFAQQGGVTSSSHITRIKYNSITRSSNIYRKALGLSVANALAYGVSESGYTIKDIIGYPNKKTPVFNKYSVSQKTCDVKSFAHKI